MPTIHEVSSVLYKPSQEYGNVIYKYYDGLVKIGVENLTTPPREDSLLRGQNSLKDVPSLIKKSVKALATWNVAFKQQFPFEEDLELTTPEQIDEAIAELEQKMDEFKPGDILDTEGYRGGGYFLIYQNDDGPLQVKRTEGEYGIILPEEAFQYVRAFGVATYVKLSSGTFCYLQGCRIPLSIASVNHKRLKEEGISTDKAIIVWDRARGLYQGNTFGAIFAGDYIINGILYEMSEKIYNCIAKAYAKADQD